MRQSSLDGGPQPAKSVGASAAEGDSVSAPETYDPLSKYRVAAARVDAATDSERSIAESSSAADRTELLKKIFKTMDSDGDGVVELANLTKVIALAHASGSTGRLSTPRSAGHGLPSARAQPASSVALALPRSQRCSRSMCGSQRCRGWRL